MAKARALLRLILRLALYGVLLICLLTTAGVWSLDRYLQPQKLKPELELAFSDYLQRPVSISSISWQWYPRPILFGAHVSVADKDGRPLLDAPTIRVYPRLKDLLRRRIFIQGLGVYEPSVILRRSADGSTNLKKVYVDIAQHMRSPAGRKPSAFSFVLRSIKVAGARLTLVDEGLKPAPLETALALDGAFDLPEGDEPATMRLRSEVWRGGQRGHLDVTGSLGGQAVIKAASQDFPLQALADYIPAVGRFEARSALKAYAVFTSSAARWAIDGRLPAAGLLSLLKRPRLSVDFRLRSDEPSSLRALVTMAKTAGEIRASTPRLARPALRIHARFSKLDVEEVQAALRPFLDAAHSIASSWSLAASLAVARGAYRGGHAEHLTALVYRDQDGGWRAEAAAPRLAVRGESFALPPAAIRYQDGDLRVSHLRFAGLGGRGTFELSSGRRFDVSWDVAELDSLRLLDFLGLRPLTTGRLRSTGRLSGDRTSRRSDQLKGAFHVELSDGVIAGLPGLLKVLSSLNLGSLLKTMERKNIRGLPFRVVSASCTVDAGMLRTAGPAALQSDTLDIGLLGSIDLARETIQADMLVQFLSVFSEVIRMVPGIKQLLIGRKKSMFPIWVKISGPLDDPDVGLQPVKSLRSKLWSTMKGILALPEDVFSGMTGVGRKR